MSTNADECVREVGSTGVSPVLSSECGLHWRDASGTQNLAVPSDIFREQPHGNCTWGLTSFDPSHPSCAAYDAACGGLLWAAATAIARPGLVESMLLLAPLVIVPLGVRLGTQIAPRAFAKLNSGAARAIWLTSSLMLCASFLFPQGVWAGVLALPWMLATSSLALLGVFHTLKRVRSVNVELAAVASLTFIAVGGAWTFLSRCGAQPMQFSDQIVQLTGVHFHYAGFALPLLAGRALPVLGTVSFRFALAAIVIGVPLVGAGIAFSPLLEVVAAMLLTAACIAVAIAQLRLSMQVRAAGARTLLAVSGMSLLGAMGLAAMYAAGEYVGAAWIEIPAMIATHGVANAIGFALCGLLAWQFEKCEAS